MTEHRPSRVGAAAAIVLLAVSGIALAGALMMFLASVFGPAQSDPHGYVGIFSAIFGLLVAPVFLLALVLVFGRRHRWVAIVVSIVISLAALGFGALLVSSALETRSSVGVNVPFLVVGCIFALLGLWLAWSTVSAASGRRRRRHASREAGPTRPGPQDSRPQDR